MKTFLIINFSAIFKCKLKAKVIIETFHLHLTPIDTLDIYIKHFMSLFCVSILIFICTSIKLKTHCRSNIYTEDIEKNYVLILIGSLFTCTRHHFSSSSIIFLIFCFNHATESAQWNFSLLAQFSLFHLARSLSHAHNNFASIVDILGNFIAIFIIFCHPLAYALDPETFSFYHK